MFSFRESILSWLNCRFSGFEVYPFVTGAELRMEGRYSGVFLEEDIGLSIMRRGGVKLDSGSRSRRWLLMLIGVNVVGAALTGVKPPALTGVNPDDKTGGGVGAGASSIGIFFKSSDSFIDALSASEARMAGDSSRRLEGVCWCDFFIGELAGDGVNGPPYSNSSC